METIQKSVYDYPTYYDTLFGADWKDEFVFLEACFERFAGLRKGRRVSRLYEPACGTGRLLWKMASAGYDVVGTDLNPKAVEYCNARLKRKKLPPSAVVADMSRYRTVPKVHAAFNTINSFRHLSTESQAEDHLRCVSDSLTVGGIYILGLHLTPPGDPLCDREEWSGRRGKLRIDSCMETLKIDRKKRKETVRLTFDVSSDRSRFRIVDSFDFRTYSAGQFSRLVARVESLEIVSTYDFSYDIDRPICVDKETEDVIYILRKRGRR